MHRTIPLHPASVLAGALLVALAVFLAGMAPEGLSLGDGPKDPEQILAKVDMRHVPHAQQWVRVREGKPFIVPPERFLVITQGVFRQFTELPPITQWLLRFDGKQVLKHLGGPGSHTRFPEGIVARPGTRVDLEVKDLPNAPNLGMVLGYLQRSP